MSEKFDVVRVMMLPYLINENTFKINVYSLIEVAIPQALCFKKENRK
ncbi:Uncharacterised protein [Chryseobacterium nakagawai]|nr:Uncharacterised protein [Chryseobacterium nakagawai]